MTPKQIEAISYCLGADPAVVKVIVESASRVSRREYRRQIISIIEDLVARTSPDTGYGKAQRRFAARVIDVIAKGTYIHNSL